MCHVSCVVDTAYGACATCKLKDASFICDSVAYVHTWHVSCIVTPHLRPRSLTPHLRHVWHASWKTPLLYVTVLHMHILDMCHVLLCVSLTPHMWHVGHATLTPHTRHVGHDSFIRCWHSMWDMTHPYDVDTAYARCGTCSDVTWPLHMLHDSFLCVTRHDPSICYMPHSYVRRVSFICDTMHSDLTWPLHMLHAASLCVTRHDPFICYMTHSYVRRVWDMLHDSSLRETHVTHEWGTSPPWCVCHVSFIGEACLIHMPCVPWLIHMCAITHSYVWRDSFICVTWLIHMWGMPHSYAMCAMTHSYVCHDSFICVTWLIHMCDMTHSYVRHASFICVPCLIHVCAMTHWYRVAKTHRIP